MKKTMIMAAGLFLMAVVSTSVFASQWGSGPGYDGAKWGGVYNGEYFRGVERLNLTQEQMAKIAEIRNTRTRELMPIREQMFAKRNALKALWLDKAPNKEKIVAAQKELNALRDQMQASITASRLEVLNVLTPEQQEIVKAQYSGRHAGRWDGRGVAGRGDRRNFNFGHDCLRNR